MERIITLLMSTLISGCLAGGIISTTRFNTFVTWPNVTSRSRQTTVSHNYDHTTDNTGQFDPIYRSSSPRETFTSPPIKETTQTQGYNKMNADEFATWLTGARATFTTQMKDVPKTSPVTLTPQASSVTQTLETLQATKALDTSTVTSETLLNTPYYLASQTSQGAQTSETLPNTQTMLAFQTSSIANNGNTFKNSQMFPSTTTVSKTVTSQQLSETHALNQTQEQLYGTESFEPFTQTSNTSPTLLTRTIQTLPITKTTDLLPKVKTPMTYETTSSSTETKSVVTARLPETSETSTNIPSLAGTLSTTEAPVTPLITQTTTAPESPDVTSKVQLHSTVNILDPEKQTIRGLLSKLLLLGANPGTTSVNRASLIRSTLPLTSAAPVGTPPASTSSVKELITETTTSVESSRYTTAEDGGSRSTSPSIDENTEMTKSSFVSKSTTVSFDKTTDDTAEETTQTMTELLTATTKTVLTSTEELNQDQSQSTVSIITTVHEEPATETQKSTETTTAFEIGTGITNEITKSAMDAERKDKLQRLIKFMNETRQFNISLSDLDKIPSDKLGILLNDAEREKHLHTDWDKLLTSEDETHDIEVISMDKLVVVVSTISVALILFIVIMCIIHCRKVKPEIEPQNESMKSDFPQLSRKSSKQESTKSINSNGKINGEAFMGIPPNNDIWKELQTLPEVPSTSQATPTKTTLTEDKILEISKF